jgi:hypothetical protein
LVEPRWDLGATIGPHFSGAFVGVAVSVEYRRRVRRSWLHLGVDLFGLYAAGNAAADDVALGGVGVRLVAEARFSMTPGVALFVTGSVGGLYARERRTPSLGATHDASDGAPSLAAGAGIYAKLGPGLLTIRLEAAWTPLVRLDLANVDGGMLSVGYRAGRW